MFRQGPSEITYGAGTLGPSVSEYAVLRLPAGARQEAHAKVPVLFVAWLLLVSLPAAANAQAIYRGRVYTGRVCSSPNCRMCNTIQRRLNYQPVTYSQPTYTIPQRVEVQQPQPIATESIPPVPQPLAAAAPTPIDAVRIGCQLLQVGPGDLLVDLGSGDGRWLIEATRLDALAIGLECDDAKIATSRQRLDATQAVVWDVDLESDYPLPPGTKYVAYLYPDLLAKVIGQIPKGARCLSYMHAPPRNCEKIVQGQHVFYRWTQ